MEELLDLFRVITERLQVSVRNQTRGVLLANRVDVARSSRERRTGLLGRKALEPGEGLWISPCESVHCFGMKFSIDLVYLDRSKKVRKVRSNMKPWRISICWTARSVLELAAGTVDRTGTAPGDQMVFEKQ